MNGPSRPNVETVGSGRADADPVDVHGAISSAVPIALPARPRILVVSLRRIGDALLTTPLIRSLRQAWPDGEINVLTFSGSAGILEGNPDIARVIAMPSNPAMRDTLVLLLRLWRRYDLAVSTQSGDRPTLFAIAAGRRRAGLTEPGRSRIWHALKRRALHRTAPAAADVHRVEQMLRLADALGVARIPQLVPPAQAPTVPYRPDGPYAVIHAAPMYRYKQWTRDGWRALAGELLRRGLAVVAIGGPDPDERQYLDDVWHGIGTVHQPAWAETTALLARARVYVGPDTSVSHLAAATGCPTVTLFGPMDPRIWGPWPADGLNAPWAASAGIQRRGNVWIVQNPLPCVPCTFEGCERHVESRSVCLDELAPAQVLAAVDQALEVGAPARGLSSRASNSHNSATAAVLR